ncbi:unnamed protein product [Spirodela intermedia]|uniref:Ubiquitin-like domain-containing protein n=1 Tax=Spirodela intermedia TaxID=51605 RepID=A0A7I8JR88_SPIIN|nr:unnamed protein product [Spirodela intermedia]CAA6672291.1 unnamed protein product [Spirodela intermedia]
METTNANEVGVSGTTEEFPESTVEINVKTLDSQTYTLRVNKYVPVPALKEQIANLTGILSGQQRLICRGKVLKDDQLFQLTVSFDFLTIFIPSQTVLRLQIFNFFHLITVEILITLL